MPAKDQYEFWAALWSERQAADVRSWLALSGWADMRLLSEEAARAYQRAREAASRPHLAEYLGKPSQVVRVHLSDEVQDHWLYDQVPSVTGYSNASWRGTGLVEEFFAVPAPVYAMLRTGPAGESPGELVPKPW